MAFPLRNVVLGLSALMTVAARVEADEPRQSPEPERSLARAGALQEDEAAAIRRFQLELVRAVGRIVSQLDYPRLARDRGWQGSTMLRLEVGPEGVVKAVTVKQSSGYSVLDERAITKLRSVALPEIPDQLRQRTFAVDIPFRFALKTATTGVECGDVEIDTSGSSSLVNLEAANDALRRYRTMVAYVMARAIPRGDYPPEGQREGSEGSTTVRLHIDASGLLKEVTVAKSSGFSVLDDYAVSKSRTVMLPDIPEVLRGRAFNLNVPFHFHYHKPEKQEAGVVLPGPSLK